MSKRNPFAMRKLIMPPYQWGSSQGNVGRKMSSASLARIREETRPLAIFPDSIFLHPHTFDLLAKDLFLFVIEK